MLTPRETKMSVAQIIFQIDEVIRDKRMPREKKIKNLQNLATTCWQEVVPEYESPETFQELESAKMQRRWASVRDEVEKSEILYVLDWPASNGNFYWVK